MKLTEAQKSALDRLKGGPVEITMWGGKPFVGRISGIRNRSTLWALHARELVTINYRGSDEIWRITLAGRLALQESDRPASREEGR